MKRKFNMRKLILSLSTIGMLALTTTASTYAWFKINAKASVENFNFEVIGGKGFMVSVDGETWSNYLNVNQLKKAMVVAMNDRYYLGCKKDDNGKIIESDVLYRIVYDKDRRIDEVVENPDEFIENKMKNLQLAPVTTNDGCNFRNILKASQNSSSGNFVEFGVYFKSTSDKESDNLKYDVYLDGYGGYDNEGNKIEPTKFTSEETEVTLMTNMNAVVIDPDTGAKSITYKDSEHERQGYTYLTNEKISVYSTNAARISTVVNTSTQVEEEYVLTSDSKFGNKYYYIKEGNEYVETPVPTGEDVPSDMYYEHIEASTIYSPDMTSVNIYEINDTENGKFDLGSYVSTYDQTYDNFDMNTYYNYSYKCNAMYTYYNNLRNQSGRLNKDDMPYETLPKTIKSLPTKSSDNITSNDYDTIVQVKSGEAEKLVTFRVWLEGWDADCFDGLSKKIDVRLALGSKKVD